MKNYSCQGCWGDIPLLKKNPANVKISAGMLLLGKFLDPAKRLLGSEVPDKEKIATETGACAERIMPGYSLCSLHPRGLFALGLLLIILDGLPFGFRYLYFRYFFTA